MSVYFQTTDSLQSITERYPETIAVFASNGFPQMEDVAQREVFGKMITLDAALQMKNLNIQTFLALLNEVISAERNNADATLAKADDNKGSGLHVVGLLPCPVRIPLLEQYKKFSETVDLGDIHTELKAASVGTDWVAANLDGAVAADDLPDLFISAGFDLFFDLQKIGRFREQGVFTDLVNYSGENSLFAGRNLQDPSGNYSIISVVPAVFLVNTAELEGRNAPRSWGELLKPEWEQSVSLPVGDFDLFNAILLNIHDVYGDEGVQKLGRSMLSAMHPAQMIKSNRLKQKRPAVTIMPYFFTKTVKEGGTMEAVWPEDGAIISPIFMLSRKERARELQPVVDFFASREVGETLSHQGFFPSLHPDVDNRLADDVPMMWLGWDRILGRDLSAEIARCEELFNNAAGGGEV
ncbi:MAG: iron ABC transporter substrate-binding protein [Desulfobacterales bacterium]|nr:MAG: iron ABC transporter substrate-binding protein [Desulfobacterales bacterium]